MKDRFDTDVAPPARTSETAAPSPAVASPLSSLPRGLLQKKMARRLQRRAASGSSPSAGGAGVIQRKAAVYKTGVELEAMKLSDFDAYAREQADWSTGPAVGGDKDQLFKLLEMARAEEALMAGCAPMNVKALLATGLDAKSLAPLRAYCGAVHKDRATVEIEPVSDVAQAIRMGEVLPKLEKTPGGVTMKTIMKQTAGQPQLNDMIAKSAVDPFIQYVQKIQPVLQANTGAEIDSYLAMKDEGVDPAAMKPSLPRVRNLHRFEKAALDQLATNEKDTSKAKPLTLVLHSALDHNGAFHRDPNVTKAVKNAKNLALMIEGKETLADVQSEIDPIAKKFGKGDKIDQVMFAGHGASRIIELGGKVTEGKDKLDVAGDDVDLDGNKAHTDALFEELMKHMDPASPNHRVIFNACLTNSNAVAGPLDADPAKAKKQIQDAIKKDGSLATTFKEKAKAMGLDLDSRGANASIGEIGLMDKTTGKLDLVSKDDPYVTADKIKYVEFGKEPEGVMRAVVEEWARDAKGCHAAMNRRQALGVPGDWDGRIIHALFAIILKGHADDADLMNTFAGGASALGEAKLEDECRVDKITDALPDAWVANVYGELAATGEWKAHKHIPLVFYQVWMRHDPKMGARFLAHLGASFTCHSASRFVDVGAIAGQMAQLLPAPPPATPPIGELTLALLDVAQNRTRANPASIAYLQALLGTERWFPKALKVVDRLGGLATETEVLQGIDRGKAPVGKTPDPNIDLDRDGTNDFYVEPLTQHGKVDAPSAAVYDKPDRTAKKLGVLAKGTAVLIMGKTGSEWLAIEYGGKTGFASLLDIAA